MKAALEKFRFADHCYVQQMYKWTDFKSWKCYLIYSRYTGYMYKMAGMK